MATPARATPAAPNSPDAPKREPGSSEGMPSHPEKTSPRDEEETLRDPANVGLALPHERDQSNAMTGKAPDPLIQQASRDLARGLQDTSKREPMDQAYEKLRKD